MDIWAIFKKTCRVLDIVLPKKRDKYSNKNVFVKLRSKEEAVALIKSLSGKVFEGCKVRLDLQKEKC